MVICQSQKCTPPISHQSYSYVRALYGLQYRVPSDREDHIHRIGAATHPRTVRSLSRILLSIRDVNSLSPPRCREQGVVVPPNFIFVLSNISGAVKNAFHLILFLPATSADMSHHAPLRPEFESAC